MRIKTGCYAAFFVGLAFSPVGMCSNEVGQLTFSIRVIQQSCVLEDDSLEVEMGSVNLPARLAKGGVLRTREFSLSLKECKGGTKAYVSMDGTPDADDKSLFALDAGGATGVALKIVKANNGEQQKPTSSGGDALEWGVDGEEALLTYQASYVVVKDSVSTGAANALVNFSITYE